MDDKPLENVDENYLLILAGRRAHFREDPYLSALAREVLRLRKLVEPDKLMMCGHPIKAVRLGVDGEDEIAVYCTHC